MKNEQIYFFEEYIKESIIYPDQKKQEEESKGFKPGDEVIYLRDGHKKDEYDPKKPIEDQTDIVGSKVILKIKNGKYVFLDQDGNQFEKDEEEILKIVKSEDEEETESQDTEEEETQSQNNQDQGKTDNTVEEKKEKKQTQKQKETQSNSEDELEEVEESLKIKKFIDFL